MCNSFTMQYNAVTGQTSNQSIVSQLSGVVSGSLAALDVFPSRGKYEFKPGEGCAGEQAKPGKHAKVFFNETKNIKLQGTICFLTLTILKTPDHSKNFEE
jgi:hypothetical protein